MCPYFLIFKGIISTENIAQYLFNIFIFCSIITKLILTCEITKAMKKELAARVCIFPTFKYPNELFNLLYIWKKINNIELFNKR